jgi:hypothetical protein
MCSHGLSEDRTEIVNSQSGPPDGRLLEYFCNCGLLVDRGLTHSLFAGSADEWIVNHLLDDPRFCEYLKISPQQKARILDLIPRANTNDITKPKLRTEFDTQQSFAVRNTLRQTLSDEQLYKLLSVYLDLEGLTALRRSEFQQALGLDAGVVKNIVSVANEINEARALPLHRRQFTLQNNHDDCIPQINFDLRKVSAETDKRILQYLSQEQRRRLIPVVQIALQITDIVQGPGIGRPWFLR